MWAWSGSKIGDTIFYGNCEEETDVHVTFGAYFQYEDSVYTFDSDEINTWWAFTDQITLPVTEHPTGVNVLK
jgi:hypothetical protein